MGLEMKYFVLKPKAKSLTDPYAMASQEAMLKYAEFILESDPELANDLCKWAKKEAVRQLTEDNTE